MLSNNSNYTNDSYGVRPVVVLSSDTEFVKENGVWNISGGSQGENSTPTPTPTPTLTLDKTTITKEITSGSTATETLTATLTNATGTLTWTSSNTSVATVSGSGSTGTVTLKAAGTATITVSYGNYSAKCTITVTEKQSGSSDLISFTVAGTTYTAEEGMTWEKWIGSTYDTSNGLINMYTLPSGTIRLCYVDASIYDEDLNMQKPSMEIQNGCDYTADSGVLKPTT